MSNIDLASKLLSLLSEHGIREYVVCSGLRNATLIGLLGKAKGIKVYYHHNENSAAYFALGRIKATGRPVAVAVTSGTASVQLHPACVEAYYSRLPLVLITADRPKHFRGTAAPQAIDQTNLFGVNVDSWHDISSVGDLPSVDSLSKTGPVHLNPCFNEPLIDKEIPTLELENSDINVSLPELSQEPECLEFLQQFKKPVISLGRLSPIHRERVIEFLQTFGAPLIADSLSGLREHPGLAKLMLTSGKGILNTSGIDSFIRIGSIPTLDFWRDLERNPDFASLPVLSITPDGFSGLARESLVIDLNRLELPLLESSVDKDWAEQLLARDKTINAGMEDLLKSFPRSELALVRELSKKIESDALVYLGNSLPIREWDLCSSRHANTRVYEANRGVNGIDGQLSTFLGCAQPGRASWCILGDLTLEYDLAGFMPIDQLEEDTDLKIVVMNNSGGRIFELLPDYNKHFKGTLSAQLIIQERVRSFKSVADYWNLDHFLVEKADDIKNLSSRAILEVKPCNEQTRGFWGEFRSLFAKH